MAGAWDVGKCHGDATDLSDKAAFHVAKCTTDVKCHQKKWPSLPRASGLRLDVAQHRMKQ